MSTQIVDIVKTANELDQMIYNVVMQGDIIKPAGKNSFRYKKFFITKGQHNSWNVFFENKIIVSTFLKISAFAICKAIDQRKQSIELSIRQEDAIFEKNYIDSIFFKNTYLVSKDYFVKDTALWRYEIVHLKAKTARQKIDRMFYSMIA